MQISQGLSALDFFLLISHLCSSKTDTSSLFFLTVSKGYLSAKLAMHCMELMACTIHSMVHL